MTDDSPRNDAGVPYFAPYRATPEPPPVARQPRQTRKYGCWHAELTGRAPRRYLPPKVLTGVVRRAPATDASAWKLFRG